MQVLISLGAEKIPDNLIVQRWTKKTRIMLEGRMDVYGRKDISLMAQTYRHSSLMISVLEYVELGDMSVERYKVAMEFLEVGKKEMNELGSSRDGLGLADREEGTRNHESVDGNDTFPLRVLEKKRGKGRPSNKRDRPGYESGSKRPRFYSICRSAEHNKLKCPQRGMAVEHARVQPTCTRCGVVGHSQNRCHVGRKQLAAIGEMLS